MPYDHKQHKLIGAVDGLPIGRRYEMQVASARRRLVLQETRGERVFKVEVAEWLKCHYDIRYNAQRPFHMSEGVSFILDFYFNSFKVAVEIDGRSHYGYKGREKDIWRDELLLSSLGIRVLHFSNERVERNPQSVIEQLVEVMLVHPRASRGDQRWLKKVWRPFCR